MGWPLSFAVFLVKYDYQWGKTHDDVIISSSLPSLYLNQGAEGISPTASGVCSLQARMYSTYCHFDTFYFLSILSIIVLIKRKEDNAEKVYTMGNSCDPTMAALYTYSWIRAFLWTAARSGVFQKLWKAQSPLQRRMWLAAMILIQKLREQ